MAFRFAVAGVMCFIAAVAIIACGGSDHRDPGVGWTGDLGVACDNVCYTAWCIDDTQIDCTSGFCLGPLPNTYCSVPCDLNSDCATGYFCSTSCNTRVAKTPVCVKNEDLAVLQSLGYCQ
jgi:hypothetical protein